MTGEPSLEGFREYTAHELARALLARPDEVLSLTVEEPDGTLVAGCLLQFKLDEGTDFDRQGVYRWWTLVARREPSNFEKWPSMKTYHASDIPVGARESVWTEGMGSSIRTLVDREWNGHHDTDVKLIWDDGVTTALHSCLPILAFPPQSEESE